MSRKRPAGQIQSSQMLEIASKLSPGSTFTDGSIEALRRCQSSFLDQLSHQLITLDKFTYTTADVQQALEIMGMTDIAQEACLRQRQNPQGIAHPPPPPSSSTPNTCLGNIDPQDPTNHSSESTITTTSTTLATAVSNTATTKKRGRKKKAIPKWSQELEDEQERLLAQTKKDMDEKHGDAERKDIR